MVGIYLYAYFVCVSFTAASHKQKHLLPQARFSKFNRFHLKQYQIFIKSQFKAFRLTIRFFFLLCFNFIFSLLFILWPKAWAPKQICNFNICPKNCIYKQCVDSHCNVMCLGNFWSLYLAVLLSQSARVFRRIIQIYHSSRVITVNHLTIIFTEFYSCTGSGVEIAHFEVFSVPVHSGRRTHSDVSS